MFSNSGQPGDAHSHIKSEAYQKLTAGNLSPKRRKTIQLRCMSPPRNRSPNSRSSLVEFLSRRQTCCGTHQLVMLLCINSKTEAPETNPKVQPTCMRSKNQIATSIFAKAKEQFADTSYKSTPS
jgi:hypothetical protein